VLVGLAVLAPSDTHTYQSARDPTMDLLNLAYPFENFNWHFHIPLGPKQAETEPATINKARAIGGPRARATIARRQALRATLELP
jgi:hypothetical protein